MGTVGSNTKSWKFSNHVSSKELNLAWDFMVVIFRKQTLRGTYFGLLE